MQVTLKNYGEILLKNVERLKFKMRVQPKQSRNYIYKILKYESLKYFLDFKNFYLTLELSKVAVLC